MDDGLRMVEVGVCRAWPLPSDPTCAGIARRMFRSAAAELALGPAIVDDGVTMVSELAANTLHIQQEPAVPSAHAPAQRQAPRSVPELWLYLRGSGSRRELVCKVFDPSPGWLHGNVPGRGVGRAPADAMSGRGLEVVHELSHGRWGHHLTRSRLAGWEARGKAVWFAVPANEAENMLTYVPAEPDEPDRFATMAAAQAMTELEDGLAARGFGGRMVRADDKRADMAVLSVRSGVTVWCRDGRAWLRTPGAPGAPGMPGAPGHTGRQWAYCDLVEVAEQTVEACETLATGETGDEQQPLSTAVRTGMSMPVLPKTGS